MKKDTPLKTRFINDLEVGEDLLDEPLLLRDMVRRTTRDDRLYLLCTFGDKTGQIGGIFWDLPAQIDAWIRPGLVLYVTGKVSRYKEVLQINVTDAYPQEHPDLSDFLPSSARSQAEMIAELRERVEGLAEPWRGLLSHLLLAEDFLPHFANAPAAKTLHHACVGGLLEHSLSMAHVAALLADHYPHVDRDLLIAGALVHDMGKVWEYSFEGSFEVSEDGQLVGHIARAAFVIEQAAAELDNVSPADVRELVHLVLSHHGTMEWGSPVTPKTLEAILLHQIDLLDSRVQGYFDHLAVDSGNGGWSTKPSFMHESVLRRPANWQD